MKIFLTLTAFTLLAACDRQPSNVSVSPEMPELIPIKAAATNSNSSTVYTMQYLEIPKNREFFIKHLKPNTNTHYFIRQIH